MLCHCREFERPLQFNPLGSIVFAKLFQKQRSRRSCLCRSPAWRWPVPRCLPPMVSMCNAALHQVVCHYSCQWFDEADGCKLLLWILSAVHLFFYFVHILSFPPCWRRLNCCSHLEWTCVIVNELTERRRKERRHQMEGRGKWAEAG